MQNEENKPPKPKRFISIEEAARRLGIPAMAARVLILHDQAIPYRKMGFRTYRVRETDLEAYIAQKGGEKPSEQAAKESAEEAVKALEGESENEKPPEE